MGQWGQAGLYDGIRVLPHVNTGDNPFNPIRSGSFVDDILLLDKKEGDVVEEYAMRKKFIGMPYSEYLKVIRWVCPVCNQEVNERGGQDGK